MQGTLDPPEQSTGAPWLESFVESRNFEETGDMWGDGAESTT